MRKRDLVTIVALATLLIPAYIAGTLANSPEPNTSPDKLELTQEELQHFTSTPMTGETYLGYTKDDLYNLNSQAVELEVKKLQPDEFVGNDTIHIKQWEGEDVVFIVPFLLERESGKRHNVITIINKEGIIAQYRTELPAYDVNLLEDRILFTTKQGQTHEIDYNGNHLWGISIDKQSSHMIEATDRGYLRVRMDYDQVIETTKNGELLWQWNALEGLPNYDANTFTGRELVANAVITRAYTMHREYLRHKGRVEWTHINYVQKLNDGYLISLRNQDLVIRLNEQNDIIWSFGPGIIKHQHCPHLLNNGNLIVFDNGNGRVAEFDPGGKLVWEYTGLTAPVWGWIEKIWNSNYIFPDAWGGRILETNNKGNTIKEVEVRGMRFYQAKAYPMEVISRFETTD